MKKRYQIGFEDPSIRCMWMDCDDNRGRFPIVDTKSLFAYGVCVAIADSEEIAKKIVKGLNMLDVLDNLD